MSRGAAVRKADLDRVMKALKDSGRDVERVEIMPGGGVTIIPCALTNAAPLDELSAWRAKRGGRSVEGS